VANEDDRLIRLEIPPEVLEHIPDDIQELIVTRPYVRGSEDERELQHLSEGRCLTCGQYFGDSTAVFVNGEGILYLLCNPLCLDDSIIFGWLMEKAMDINQKVKFRGEEGNAPSTDEDEQAGS